jgi:hypothetical protein
MRKINWLACLAIALLGPTLLNAQASRTWVSGVGDDANPCSRTAPCKTWAGAISKTAPGGEIDALDPGGFGAVTITKAITLDGGGGQVASVLVTGTNGIVVQAGANDTVIIRNLRLNGISSGLNGIQFNSGKDLNVENCFIFGFTQNGINITLNQGTAASVHIINTIVKNNGGVGIRATNAVTPPVQVGITNTAAILDNIGIEAAQHSRVVVRESVAQNAAADGIKVDDAATSDAQASIYLTDASFNVNGVTNGTGGSLNIAFSNLSYNSSCQFNNAGASGQFVSYGNNRVAGGNCGTITGPIPQL